VAPEPDPMAVRDHTATIALCTSLVLHGAISCYLLNRAASDFGNQTWWAALPVPEGVVRSPVFIDEPAPPPAPLPPEKPAPPEPKPVVPQVPSTPRPEPAPQVLPPEQELQPQPIPKPELAPDSGMPKPIPVDGFGELTGEANATAIHSLSGDKPMQAPKAEQDQPLIRREPSVRSGDPDGAKATEEPAVAAETIAAKPAAPIPPDLIPVALPKPPKPAPAPEPVKVAVPEPQQKPSAQSVAASLLVPGSGADKALPGKDQLEPLPKPVEIASAQDVVHKRVSSDPSVIAPTPAKVFTGPSAKTSQAPAGDVAPQSDSDSDAFTTTGSAEFRPGKVVARFGRAVKMVRPKLNLAGRNDLLSLMDPTVTLEVRADETGTVRDVRITRSSGSNEVDQPCKLAMYQWWFEPPRDSSGRPRPAVMTWTIHFAVW